MSKSSIRIPPFHYIHILDKNTNVTRLIVGPQTFIRLDHEYIVTGDLPLKMIVLRPRTYCQIRNPVILNEKKELTVDKFGQINVLFGEIEYRFFETYSDPFPLFPREELLIPPSSLPIVNELSALRIEAIRNFKDNEGNQRIVGEQWLHKGPSTYYPRKEEVIVNKVSAEVIQDQYALRLKATIELVDRKNIKRKEGEEWLVREKGAYLPDVYEEVVTIVDPIILTEDFALHFRATENFQDAYGIKRKAGEEWLIKNDITSFHIPDIYEELVNTVDLTVLNANQYCIIYNPVDQKTKKNKYGTYELRTGESTFFLQPGEQLIDGIKNSYLLEENQALLLTAQQKIDSHEPGEKWLVKGPCKYIPPIEVRVLEKRSAIPLDKNEGIYVRDIKTGVVRTVIGESYLLNEHEELYELLLPETVEKILAKESKIKDYKREKHKLVTVRCPFNSAVQIYDFKKKNSRVVFGPNLVMLGPDELFTVTTLSGSMPKRPGVLTKIVIDLGPVFSSDSIVVETSDHAALRLTLSYNWLFRLDKTDQVEAAKIFSVKDFIGDLCNIMASKVRSAIAGVDFDTFHKTSARLIRKAVFGVDVNGKIRSELILTKNNAVITNVDIQSVEPVDENTKENLQKTVALAIEITTKRQEALAMHNAAKLNQEAQGELAKLQIESESQAEEAKKNLFELQAKSNSIKIQGVATATAKANAEAGEIQARSSLKNAELLANAGTITFEADNELFNKKRKVLLDHEKKLLELELVRNKSLAEIESWKFEEMVGSIGKETIVSMANAGPEFQAELLSGLGLQGFIMTDGNNPVNLFNTASGLIGGPQEN